MFRTCSRIRDSASPQQDVSKYIEVAGPVDAVLHFASPASPPDYLKFPIQTLKVGALGTHNALGLAMAKKARFLHGLHVGMLWRSGREPAAGNLLGPCESDRAARRLRRGQTIRRSHDHGLSPLPRRGHAHRADLQHLWPAHAAERRPGAAEFSLSGAGGRADHRLRRRQADAQLLLRVGFDRGNLPAAGVERARAGQHRQSARKSRFSNLPSACARWSARARRSCFHPLPQDDPKQRCPDITKARRILKWEPKVKLEEGLRTTYEYLQAAGCRQQADHSRSRNREQGRYVSAVRRR